MPKKTARATETAIPTSVEELKAKFAEFPNLDVLERRMLDPNDPGSLPIMLADEPNPSCGDIGHAMQAKKFASKCPVCRVPFRDWYIRWANTAEQERWSTIRNRGYVKVLVKELRDRDDVAGMGDRATEDPVTRGDKRQEVLVKMPFPYYIEIKREREAQMRAKQTLTGVRQDLVASAGREFGDQAASEIGRDIQVEEVLRHQTTLGEELGAGE